jgi:hypothetical protein
MKKKSQKVHSQSEWEQIFINWETSGKSISSWCKENNESFHSFKHWRRVISGNYNRFPPLKPIDKSSFEELPLDNSSIKEIQPKSNNIISKVSKVIFKYFLFCLRFLGG